MRGRQEFSSVAAALALHAAVLGFAWLVARDRASDSRPPVAPRAEVSWEVELGEAPAEESSVERGDPPNGTETEAAIDQTKRENPTTKNPTPDDIAIKLDTPGLYLAETGEVLSYRVGVGSISPGYQVGAAAGPVMQGSFDPTHIGAKPQRMVRTRVVEESMF